MLRRNLFLVFCVIFVLNSISTASARLSDERKLKIATWNLWDFAAAINGNWKQIGDKCTDNYVCQGYYDVIVSGDYDIVFVQEIKDDFSYFSHLCSDLKSQSIYECNTTQNMGGSNTGGNNEGYGVIYKKDLKVSVEYTGNSGVTPNFTQGLSGSHMARPPMKAFVTLPSGVEITIFNNHIKTGKGEVERELNNLETKLNENKGSLGDNIVVLGDLNADGGSNLKYGKGVCNNYYLSGGSTETAIDDITDDSDDDGNGIPPLDDGSDYYPSGSPEIINTTNFKSNNGNYGWGWTIYNGFNMTEGSNPEGTSQGTNMPNAANKYSGNRGCVYDRIIITKELFDHRYKGVSGAVGNIPKTIYNVPSPRNGVTGNSIPEQTSFKDIIWYGKKGNDVYGLSDHKLVWTELNFGGISPTNEGGGEKLLFLEGENIYFRGKGFVPDKSYFAYVVPYFPVNTKHKSINDIIEEGGQIYTYLVKIEKDTGEILNMNLGQYEAGKYLIFVDIDNDNSYSKETDPKERFEVIKTSQKRKTADISAFEYISIASQKKMKTGAESIKSNTSTTIIMNGFSANTTGALLLQDAISLKELGILTNVTTDSNGNFEYVWKNGFKAGVYNIIFHPYQKGPVKYNFEQDVIDYDNSIGFIVSDEDISDDNSTTLDDNGNVKEVFKISETNNIYIIDKNLPIDQDVDIYAVSKDNLPENVNSWKDAQNLNNIKIRTIAVPLNESDAKNNIPSIQAQRVSSNGKIFKLAMQNPASFVDEGYYKRWGKSLNMLIDVNRNGIFDNGDIIDTHQINKILENIDDVAANKEATQQYQRLMNSKLNLEENLVLDGIYGEKTKDASYQYICERSLNDKMSNSLQKSAEIGFKVVIDQEKIEGEIGDAINNYGIAYFNNIVAHENSFSCQNASTVSFSEDVDLGQGTYNFAAAQIFFEKDVLIFKGSHIRMLIDHELISQ